MKSFNITVDEALNGLADISGGSIAYLPHPRVRVIASNCEANGQVAVIGGGGSGHEPLYSGYVGSGILQMAIAGDYFASPSVEGILMAILTCRSQPILMVVLNYTGDRLNFGLAIQKAIRMGCNICLVISKDDVSLPMNAQPRGIAGTIYILKIAGALSLRMENLENVYAESQAVADRCFSVGCSLTVCTLPNKKVHDTRLDSPNHYEFGLGIHGESGAALIELTTADAIVSRAVDALLVHIKKQQIDVNLDVFALSVNNLGTVPQNEILGISGKALGLLQQHVKVVLVQTGTLCTSLNMNGFSISLLAIPNNRMNLWCSALLDPCDCVGWSPFRKVTTSIINSNLLELWDHAVADACPNVSVHDNNQSIGDDSLKIIEAVCDTILSRVDDLNELDKRVGDGDCGTTVSQACLRIKADARLYPSAAADIAISIAKSISQSCGGTFGILSCIFFEAVGAALAKLTADISTLDVIRIGLSAGCDAVRHFGGASVGSRTLVDALIPASSTENMCLTDIATNARVGANSTAEMATATHGRSSYIRRGMDVNDPGAEIVAIALATIASCYQ